MGSLKKCLVCSFTSTRIDHIRDHAKIWHKDDYFSRGLKSLETSKDNIAETKRYEREVRKRFDCTSLEEKSGL